MKWAVVNVYKQKMNRIPFIAITLTGQFYLAKF